MSKLIRPPAPQDRSSGFWWLIFKATDGQKVPCCMLWSPAHEGWAAAAPSLADLKFEHLPAENFVLIRRADGLTRDELCKEMSAAEISRKEEAVEWNKLF